MHSTSILATLQKKKSGLRAVNFASRATNDVTFDERAICVDLKITVARSTVGTVILYVLRLTSCRMFYLGQIFVSIHFLKIVI